MNNPTIRIGVLGELGVGKSELVQRICQPTVRAFGIMSEVAGPAIDVLDFERPGRSSENFWIEFLVIPSETRHPRSRQMLYSIGLDALFMVCSCASPNTFLRAAEWLEEARSVDGLQNVPIALILGGPVAMDWEQNPRIIALVEPLSSVYKAQVLDLSGYTSTQSLSLKQNNILSDFYEKIARLKQESVT
ncbi:hypothetical protein H4R99_003602 [Coemansia sp. RSA 1722]|nr:hypothetical protein LPJ57_003694 [Coemansia sp. RSA 486]KAJ2232471.1 Rab-like protein 3 [Coemansia sp. RSA 485]KAJ2599718.1 hypothetical protein H4R99_003602 [Coemansia sp. RSA 1722]